MATSLPRPPSVDALRAAGMDGDEYFELPTETVIWRAHRTSGDHVLAWNELRTFGPLSRFDRHPRPRQNHPRHGVWYGADDVPGALAEMFRATRVIDRTAGSPYLTGLRFTRPLRLLDVGGFGGGRWPVGGNFALGTAAHGIAQHWARAIRAADPVLDGLV